MSAASRRSIAAPLALAAGAAFVLTPSTSFVAQPALRSGATDKEAIARGHVTSGMSSAAGQSALPVAAAAVVAVAVAARTGAAWNRKVGHLSACKARKNNDDDSGGGLALSNPKANGVGFPEVDLRMAFAESAEKSVVKVTDEHPQPMVVWNHPNWSYSDVATVFVRGGRGGDGCKSFRREACEPLGGPDGGNGGHGGHVFLRADRHVHDLKCIMHLKNIVAKNGVNGLGDFRNGGNGDHIYVQVPCGTVVYCQKQWVEGTNKLQSPGRKRLMMREDVREMALVGELTTHGQLLRVSRGGVGGKGNRAFFSHRDTAPFIREVGEWPKGRWINIVVKQMSDVGIIGCPNAGKSSFLSAVTNKKAKIGSYAFTTTTLNQGFWKANDHGGLTLADVPGLIDGAHSGRGMGVQFLRHIERCKTLIHVVSGDSEDPIGDFDMIQRELRAYSTAVAMKPQVVVVNKCDIPSVQENLPELMRVLREHAGHTRVYDISVATRYHVEELMERVWKWHQNVVREEMNRLKEVNPEGMEDAEFIVSDRLISWRKGTLAEVETQEPVQLEQELPKGRRTRSAFKARIEWDVLEEAWRIIHPEVERIAFSTDWRLPYGYDRFNRACKKTGVTEALRQAGVEEGQAVVAGEHRFHYRPSQVGHESRMLIYDADSNWE